MVLKQEKNRTKSQPHKHTHTSYRCCIQFQANGEKKKKKDGECISKHSVSESFTLTQKSKTIHRKQRESL